MEKVYAFIDSQNLHLGVSKDIVRNNRIIYKGWNLSFKRFRGYLFYKYRVSKAFLFIGYVRNNTQLYKYLTQAGYSLIFKPTVKDKNGKVKGNVDAELVLHSAKIEYKNYDKAVIVSGDGDFHCLHKELLKDRKLLKILIPNTKSESSLLSDFQRYKVFIQRDRSKLEALTKRKSGRRRI